jgi:hypothetical protein
VVLSEETLALDAGVERKETIMGRLQRIWITLAVAALVLAAPAIFGGAVWGT